MTNQFLNNGARSNEMVDAMNELIASTADRRTTEDAAVVSRVKQADAICRAFSARVPSSVMTSITGLTRSRIFQIRREACLSDDSGDEERTG